MNITTSRSTGFICSIAFSIQISMAAMHAHGNDTSKPLAQSDGLNLFVRVVKTPNLGDTEPQLLCELENTNQFPIRFVDNGRANRFSFRLLDEKGQEIKANQKWLQWNDPYASDVGKRAPGEIGPGERLSFLLRVHNAYDSLWVSGKLLEVKWEPDNSNDGLFEIGWEMKGRFDFTSLTGRKIEPQPEPRQSGPSDNLPTIEPKPTAATDDRPERRPSPPAATERKGFRYGLWAWIGGAIIALLAGAFWLGRKAASRSI